jgi:crotonobetainyl-CoA:carnitine CoA-transferase CaiB-like acyl-CoA transferase
VALDLQTEEARRIAHQLIERADVFVTNMRPRVLDQYGLSYDALSKLYPRLVYAQITGYGPDGEERDRAAYDIGAFWSRAGVAAALAPPGAELPQQRGGMGDHMAGMAAAGARLRRPAGPREDGPRSAGGRLAVAHGSVHDGLGYQPGPQAQGPDPALRPAARD